MKLQFSFIKRIKKKLSAWAKKVTLPGFQGQSIYTVGKLFFQGLSHGYILERASGVAFNFFIALFPLLLMVFTLIPYIPIDNFQQDLLESLQEVIPPNVWDIFDDTIIHIITQKSVGLLSVGFLFSLFFATNGISSLYSAFHQMYHSYDNFPNFLKQRWYALIILLSIFLIVILFVIGLSYVKKFFLAAFPDSEFFFYLYQVIRVIVGFSGVIFSVAMIYYTASSRKLPFKLFSPGTIVCTFLMLLTTLGFNLFISNFSRYNFLYGSLGAILILTLFLQLNAVFLLIGFEINASIRLANPNGKNPVTQSKKQEEKA